jgi:HlyD family secretion protein
LTNGGFEVLKGRLFLGLLLMTLAPLVTAGGRSAPAEREWRVREGQLLKYLTFSGEIQAKESVTVLTPDIRGIRSCLISYLAPDGSYVRPGDLLVSFDPTDLEVRRLDTEKDREEARIAIAQKEADIETRRQDLLMNVALAEKNLRVAALNAAIDPELLARSDAERYKLDYSKAKLEHEKAVERLTNLENGAKAELELVRLAFEQADLDLKRLMSDLKKMTITAPAEGLVLVAESWQSGRKFQEGDSVWEGFPLVSLPDLRKVQVLAYVHTRDYPLLQGVSSAEVVLDALPGRIFHAELAELPQAATPYRYRSELKVFRVLFDVKEIDTNVFKPGMTARVRIAVPLGNGLIVARAALQQVSADRALVQVAGANEPVSVTVLGASAKEVLVKGDLRDGQKLVVHSTAHGRKSSDLQDWITVKKQDLTFSVSGGGILQAAKAVEIQPPSIRGFHRFKITSMVEEGSHVQAGDPILDFDRTEVMDRIRNEAASLAKVKEERGKTQAALEVQRKDLELELEEAKVQDEKAANRLVEAREFESDLRVKTAEYEALYASNRVKMLEKKLASVKTHGQLQLKILDDRIRFYQTRLQLVEEARDSFTVKAPISGVVIYKANWNNEKKQVGSDVHYDEIVMTLPDLTTLEIEGQVAEVDAGKIRLGQRVSVALDAIPDRTFHGSVSSIRNVFNQASPDRPVKVLQLKVDLKERDLSRMRPGMVARLDIVIDRFSDVLAVPLSVVELEDGKSFVWVKAGDEAERRPVELGKNNGLVAVVTAGLSEGDQVAGRPADMAAAD